jgi:3-deoxy-manno-octulosonate cytidylyltransferase (CMP-KDO synthetase)
VAECVAVIPARISSSRIPQKPLSDLCGKTLIQRVYENALNLRSVDEIVVATDSEKVADVIKEFKGRFILTPPELASGSDRVYYTAQRFFPDARIIGR